MKIYNTLTRTSEDFKPLNPPQATIYTCGPTVYDYAHVGHWFNYVRMDTLVRTLKANNFEVKWVMNITDVGHLTSDADEGEDKLEKGAKREGKSAWEIADFYTQDFISGMKELNMLNPDEMPKATEHVEDQIKLIKVLEDKGYTYLIENDGIYYDTSKFEGYANFARLDLDDQMAGARVAVNKNKRQPYDFALWKFSPSDRQRDMEWDSPWGKGFPGWHIECSAMSMKYLGESIDIHTGGIDHVPIHHTNEIAQSEAATGKRFAGCWFHSNHVLIDEQKISKSLNNGIKLSDVYDKGYSAEVLRLHILESHYRSQSNFNWTSLDAAKNRLNDLYSLAALRYQAKEDIEDEADIENISARLLAFLSDDLNTPEALALLSSVSNKLLATSISTSELDLFLALLKLIDDLLGLKLSVLKDINDDQKKLIYERQLARTKEDWARSDEIRKTLEAQKIGVRDTPSGAIWYPL